MILFFCFIASCVGAEGFQSAGSDLIYTYYEGEFLEKAFDLIQKILYGNSAAALDRTFTALLRISLIVGAFTCVLAAFFRQTFTPLIRNFFFCALGVTALLLVPITYVRIVDYKGHPVGRETTIKVPFFLGKFASWMSRSVYHLHQLFVPKETYPWVQNITAQNNPFGSNSFPLSSSLEADLREFCHECVFRDLQLGFYSKEQLGEAQDVLAFLKEGQTSIHGTMYSASDAKTLSCPEAKNKIFERFEEELQEMSSADISMLFGKKSDSQSFIGHKIAIDFLKDELGCLKGKERHMWGSFIAASLISIGGFFEALLYLSFPLAILLSLLSFGIRVIAHWIKLVVWISFWPLFYPVVDLFLQSLWTHRVKGLFPYTFNHSERFLTLYGSMESLAAIAILCIPILSWLMIKSTMHQVVHIATSFAQTPPVIVEQNAKEGPSDAILLHPHIEESAKQSYHGNFHGEQQDLQQGNAPEDSFNAGIREARKEERGLALQKAVSSVETAVTDSGERVSKSIKTSTISFNPEPVIAEKEEGLWVNPSQNHNFSPPVHGSWSQNDK